jgi:hypothetical protein
VSTLWVASKGFRLHPFSFSRTSPVARFVYTKPPFAGPAAVLTYLARYTHCVAISNSRLVSLDQRGVSFRYKDYRRNGQARYGTMTLSGDEFIRRFLLHVLPKGFYRIRHYGLLASATCKANVAGAREPHHRACRPSISQRNTTSRMRPQAPLPIIAHHALVAAGA